MSGACAAGHPARCAADPPAGFSREDLVSRGFEGFISLRQLPRRPATIPNVSGVYAAVRASGDPVAFVDETAGGHFKGRDPRVARGTLTRAWINGTDTTYLGRARLLRRRIDELARFGRGESVGHWGGRYLWQLADHDNLLVSPSLLPRGSLPLGFPIRAASTFSATERHVHLIHGSEQPSGPADYGAEWALQTLTRQRAGPSARTRPVARRLLQAGGRIVDGAVCAPYLQRVMDPSAKGGRAGASARREGERRRARREAGVRARHPRIGGVILALQDAPQHERSWARGAGGEELVEQALAKHCRHVPVLHDRRSPGSKANIAHIAIAASGVGVIDTKRYKGRLHIAKPLFGKPTLKVAGRDQTKLVDGLAKQVALVTAAVADLEVEIPVRGCFCFVDTELPLLGTPTINGLSIFGRRGLAKQLNTVGELSAERALTLAAAIGEQFPVA